jgi:uncharacterized membrane protein YeaQ/YmgE (transglycosylase-associated protein family)
MEIVWMLVVGLIIGALAKLLMPGRDPGGFIVTILLGIAGAFIAGLAGRALGIYSPGEPAGVIASILGAMLVLLIYRIVVTRWPRSRRV